MCISVALKLMALPLVLVLFGNNLGDAMELVFSNVVWRHGDRSYIVTYPNDPYKDKGIWKNGLGQLTNIGMKQQYELGQFLRKRYDKILSKEYLRDEIYIRSTDKDRTLMSAESNMAGLYPPTKDEQWNGSNTVWHPIPIHTVPLDIDKLLRYPIGDCPNYDKMRKKIQQSPWYIQHEKDHSQFYDFLMSNTGVKEKINLTNVWTIEDNLFCLQSHNYSLPPWATGTPDILTKLKHLNSLDMGLMYTDVDYQYRESMTQMQGGVLLKQILQNMTAHVNGGLNQTVIAYSAHDTTLAAILVAIGNYDWVQPKYASCVMFELYRNGSDHFVKIYYRNTTESQPTLLKFYECDVQCPFHTFQRISSRLVPDNRAEICGVSMEEMTPKYLIVIVILGIAAVLLIIVFSLRLVCKTNKKPTYQPIPDDLPPI